jgi:pimeloyl-ACP methyl ester carboxylesterase
MKKAVQSLKPCSLIALIAFLLSFSVAQAQSGTSYIIVHALNPEGIEIASIEGMDSHCVEIYDGDILIGYGAHDNETYNKPIAISSGAHTIKVKFNGMELSQDINLQEGETRILTFTFERTEIEGILSQSMSDSAREVEKHEGPTSVWGAVSVGKTTPNRFYAIMPISYSVGEGGGLRTLESSATWTLSPTSFNVDIYGSGLLEGDISGGFSAIELSAAPAARFPVSIPADSNFDRWFAQSINVGSFDVRYIFLDSEYINSADYEYFLRTLPANKNYETLRVGASYDDWIWSYKKGAEGKVLSISHSVSDTFSVPGANLKISSVPYDLTGAGIKCEEERGKLIITEAKTDKDTYALNEEVRISCSVIDDAETNISGVSVRAEITKPDDSKEIISLEETDIGVYEGTFTHTSLPGTYNVTIKAEKEGYTGATAEVSFTVGPTLEILDGVDFSAGREISDKPEKLASGGTPVTGAVTDGVTRLLLRLNLGELNEVTFSLEGTGNPEEDGVLRSIDGTQEGKSITVYTDNVNEQEYAFAIYQAPENFVRWDYRDQDRKVSERTITLHVKSNRSPSFEFSEEIKLVRPPVILVHGLWSSRNMWIDSEFANRLKLAIHNLYIVPVDYRETNASHFEVNKDVLCDCERKDSICKVKEKLKAKGIAMVQADVIGHSMGGLLGRIWAGAGDYVYKRNNNFWMGDINKLITLDSPHYGSFLADVGMEYINDLEPEIREWILEEFRENETPLNEGAVEDMMTTSKPIDDMNKINIISASHAIVGYYPVTNIDFWFLSAPLGWVHRFLTLAGYDTRPYVVDGDSDLVVSTESQAGGLTPPTSSNCRHHHLNATTEEVLNEVIYLLNADPEKWLFNPGFPVKEDTVNLK